MADKPRKNWFARAVDAVAETETNPLALAWRMLPPEARKAYASLPNAVAELSPGAAIRDTVQASGETGNALMQGRGWDAAGGVANMLTAAAGVIPGGRLITKGAKELAQPIRAYHGSPHSFDRFDMSKIGTGEGAQAYGHGLYFAENEAVAKGYRDALAGKNSPVSYQAYKGGEPVAWHALTKEQGDLMPILLEAGGDLTKAKEIVRAQYMPRAHERLTRGLDDLVAGGYEARAPGSMYEVNIHADPARFLDWDKPLSQQAEIQKPILNALERSLVPRAEAQDLLTKKTGGDVLGRLPRPSFPVRDSASSPWRASGAASYEEALEMMGGNKSLVNRMLNPDPAYTSQTLRDAGIPGIKYLDQGSRGAGEGSRNYVAFDDKMIEILRKYGLLPVAAGGAAVAANPLSVGEGETY